MARHSSEAGSGQNRGVQSVPSEAELAVVWLDEPEEHDYPAAADYLSLLADTPQVELLVAALAPPRPGNGQRKTCCVRPACRCCRLMTSMSPPISTRSEQADRSHRSCSFAAASPGVVLL